MENLVEVQFRIAAAGHNLSEPIAAACAVVTLFPGAKLMEAIDAEAGEWLVAIEPGAAKALETRGYLARSAKGFYMEAEMP